MCEPDTEFDECIFESEVNVVVLVLVLVVSHWRESRQSVHNAGECFEYGMSVYITSSEDSPRMQRYAGNTHTMRMRIANWASTMQTAQRASIEDANVNISLTNAARQIMRPSQVGADELLWRLDYVASRATSFVPAAYVHIIVRIKGGRVHPIFLPEDTHVVSTHY